MSREILQQARQLIIEERYADARALLLSIKDHPTAQEWLDKIEAGMGDEAPKPRNNRTSQRQPATPDTRGIRLIYLLSLVIVGLLSVLVLGVLPVHVKIDETSIVEWEYLKVEQTEDGFLLNDTALADTEKATIMDYISILGNDGWELVSVAPSDNDAYLFKRPKNDDTSQPATQPSE